MPRPGIARDRDFVQGLEAKIETGPSAVKPRVDLELYHRLYSAFPTGRSGGTGRRAGFRSQWAQAHGGSSPPFGIELVFSYQ